MSTTPTNPHRAAAENFMAHLHFEGKSHEAHLIGAVLALAHEQHRTALAAERQATALEARVRIAAITAKKRGLPLPTDLNDLATALIQDGDPR